MMRTRALSLTDDQAKMETLKKRVRLNKEASRLLMLMDELEYIMGDKPARVTSVAKLDSYKKALKESLAVVDRELAVLELEESLDFINPYEG